MRQVATLADIAKFDQRKVYKLGQALDCFAFLVNTEL